MDTGKVAIIGAGYAGLSAAYELARNGSAPTVFESGGVAGGLAACVRLQRTHLEKFYHHWFNHDHAILELVHELGLSRHLIRRETGTANYHDGRVYRLSSPLDVLRFEPLSRIDRFRLGRMVLRGRAVKDYRQLEGLTARQWITEMAGRTVYDVVWRPLFEGKFGHYADEVSAVWFWSKLQTRSRSRSRRQREELLYLDGGLERLTRAMLDAIVDRGGRVRLGCPVRGVRRSGGRWDVVTEAGCESFERVVVTTPTPIATDLLGDLPDGYRRRAAAIPYLGVTELMLVLNRPLSETYWLNVNDPGYPFVGVIEHTNFQRPETYGGRHVVYLTKYHDPSHETVRMDHQALFERWGRALQRMFPSFEASAVTLASTWRSAHAQPVVLAGRERQVLPAATPLPGVWLCTMAQVYPEDRGTNYAVRSGRAVARQLLGTTAADVRSRRIVRVSWPAPEVPGDQPAPLPAAALEGLSPA